MHPNAKDSATSGASGALGQALARGAQEAVAHATQFSTFVVAGRLCGIDVTRVQEVVRPMPITVVPLAPAHIAGLINLRGQVATAIGLRELFALPHQPTEASMNVVCKADGTLLSLLVDEIGDVVEVRRDDFERTPATVDEHIRKFMTGIFKVNGALLSVLDVELIGGFLGLTSKGSRSA